MDSEVLYHGPCDRCGSRNNRAYYDDGHSYCFTPGCGYRSEEVEKPMNMIQGEAKALPSRGLTKDTCRRWKYEVATFHDTKGVRHTVQVANYLDNEGDLVAQKLRYPNKSFTILGDAKQMSLYGKWRCQGSGRRLIITEGELDALSVSQVLLHKWPVVSLPNGASSAKKAILKELTWLSQFEEIVLCFDQDEAGRDAIKEVVGLFPPGKVSIVTLPLKDPNEMIQADRKEELIQALWGAKPYRPDGIVTVADVMDAALKEPEWGLPWFIEELNFTTYGRRYGECVALGAGTGVGKTTFIMQQISADLEAGHQVAIFAFEQIPAETVKRVAGIMDGKAYHIPSEENNHDQLQKTLKKIQEGPTLHLYDHFGACDWEVVKERIRYLAHAEGVKLFYIDHITALAAEEDDERKAIERMMAELGRLVKELDIWILAVSHLSTPEGKPHEEGGRVMIRHFKGSRAIGYWMHFIFGIERAQQADDEEEREASTFRVLKDRYTGRATGQTIDLGYSHETGRFVTGAVFTAEEKDECF